MRAPGAIGPSHSLGSASVLLTVGVVGLREAGPRLDAGGGGAGVAAAPGAHLAHGAKANHQLSPLWRNVRLWCRSEVAALDTQGMS